MPSLTSQVLDRSGARLRVKVWCQLHGKSQVWLAEQIGKKKQDIDNVAAGRYRGGPVVEGVARVMSCRVDWLLYGVGAAPDWWPAQPDVAPPIIVERQVPPKTTVDALAQFPQPAQVQVDRDRPFSMPWSGQVTAGGGFADPSQDGDDWQPVPFKAHWRLVRVQGTSAVPVLLPGQAAIVDDQVPVRDGRMVCVQTNDGRAYLKRWNTVGDHVVLSGINGGHESLVLERSQIARIGVVVGTLYCDSVAK